MKLINKLSILLNFAIPIVLKNLSNTQSIDSWQYIPQNCSEDFFLKCSMKREILHCVGLSHNSHNRTYKTTHKLLSLSHLHLLLATAGPYAGIPCLLRPASLNPSCLRPKSNHLSQQTLICPRAQPQNICWFLQKSNQISITLPKPPSTVVLTNKLQQI